MTSEEGYLATVAAFRRNQRIERAERAIIQAVKVWKLGSKDNYESRLAIYEAARALEEAESDENND